MVFHTNPYFPTTNRSCNLQFVARDFPTLFTSSSFLPSPFFAKLLLFSVFVQLVTLHCDFVCVLIAIIFIIYGT